jgi:hypothetical protein
MTRLGQGCSKVSDVSIERIAQFLKTNTTVTHLFLVKSLHMSFL